MPGLFNSCLHRNLDVRNRINVKRLDMLFDLELIKKVYATFPEKVAAARQLIGRDLTLSEKYCTPIYGMSYPCSHLKGGLIM